MTTSASAVVLEAPEVPESPKNGLDSPAEPFFTPYGERYPAIRDPASLQRLSATGSPAEARRAREEALRLLLRNEIGVKKYGEMRATYADVCREFHQAEQRALERLALGTAKRLELGLSPDFAALVDASRRKQLPAIEITAQPELTAPQPATRRRGKPPAVTRSSRRDVR